MKKSVIVTTALIILAGGGFMWWTSNATDAPAGAPAHSQAEAYTKSALAASEQIYDFGLISMKKGNVNYAFKVTNPTDKDIMINDVATSCMCTTAYLVEGIKKLGPFGMPGMGPSTKTNKIIKAGGIMYVDVVFDPNAHGPAGVGPLEREIQLTEADGSILRLEIKGMVKP